MKQNKDLSLMANAASNATEAARSAAEAASRAAENATIAAKAASDSATAIAVVGTDTSWMKKSLAGIENTLEEMRNSYITAAQHVEVLKNIADHETRINLLETEKTRITVLLMVGMSLLSILTSIMIYHLIGR